MAAGSQVLDNFKQAASTFSGDVKTIGAGISDKFNSVKNSIKDKFSTQPSLPEKGSLSNSEARDWYVKNVRGIGDVIDKGRNVKEQAKQAFELRNQYKEQARSFMADSDMANKLNKSERIYSWEIIVNKYEELGYYGDALWQEIIDASMRTRDSVNRMFGID